MKKMAAILMVFLGVQSTSNSYAVNVAETAKQVVHGVMSITVKTTKYVTHRIQSGSIRQRLFYSGCVLLFISGALQVYFGCKQLYSLTKDASVLKYENKKNSITNQFGDRAVNKSEDDKDYKNS